MCELVRPCCSCVCVPREREQQQQQQQQQILLQLGHLITFVIDQGEGEVADDPKKARKKRRSDLSGRRVAAHTVSTVSADLDVSTQFCDKGKGRDCLIRRRHVVSGQFSLKVYRIFIYELKNVDNPVINIY